MWKIKGGSFPTELKQIGPLTFFGCTDLQVDCMSGEITAIGNGAYQDCTSRKTKQGSLHF